jgi:hypothetical protein
MLENPELGPVWKSKNEARNALQFRMRVTLANSGFSLRLLILVSTLQDKLLTRAPK